MLEDVLDVLSADVAGSHDLVHGVCCRALTEEFDQQDEANGLALNGTIPCRKQPKVATSEVAQTLELGGQITRLGTRLVLSQRSLVRIVLHVVAHAPRAD